MPSDTSPKIQFKCYSLVLFLQVKPGDTSDKVIVFFKTKPEPITPDNMHSTVFVSSMLDSPVSALYHAVQKVYAPVLLKDEKFSKNFDPKLQDLLSQLEAGLGSVIRKQNPYARAPVSEGKDNYGGILSLNFSDESQSSFF